MSEPPLAEQPGALAVVACGAGSDDVADAVGAASRQRDDMVHLQRRGGHCAVVAAAALPTEPPIPIRLADAPDVLGDPCRSAFLVVASPDTVVAGVSSAVHPQGASLGAGAAIGSGGTELQAAAWTHRTVITRNVSGALPARVRAGPAVRPGWLEGLAAGAALAWPELHVPLGVLLSVVVLPPAGRRAGCLVPAARRVERGAPLADVPCRGLGHKAFT